jgi:hypothetical protein
MDAMLQKTPQPLLLKTAAWKMLHPRGGARRRDDPRLISGSFVLL